MEKTFVAYFEIYGKKLKVEVEAKTELQAKQIVRNKILFHKIEEVKKESTENTDTATFNFLKDIFGIK